MNLGVAKAKYKSGDDEPFHLSRESLLTHAYILGASGSGKTFLIYAMIRNLIRQHQGFCVIDIHGDLTQMLLAHLSSIGLTEEIRKEVSDRLILFEPYEQDWAPSFNPLHMRNERQAYQQASDMHERFKSLWADVNWGPRMLEVLRNALLTLSLAQLTLCDAGRLLTDRNFRTRAIEAVHDPILRAYWTERFEPLSDKMKAVYAEPVINKLTLLTDDLYLRHVLSQRQSRLDFRAMMDQGKWVLVNISKGIAGANARAIGSLVVSKLRTAALSRVDVPENRRRPFFLFVDEFQNFLHYNFEEILSEARKFRLALILAHQHLDQIDRSMCQAIFGNIGTMILFRLGHYDVHELAHSLTNVAKIQLSEQLMQLNVGEALIRKSDCEFRFVRLHRLSRPKQNETVLSEMKLANHTTYCKRRSEIDAALWQQNPIVQVLASPAPQADNREKDGARVRISRNTPDTTQLPTNGGSNVTTPLPEGEL